MHDCLRAEVRLTNGAEYFPGSCYQGRLEVNLGGFWGTVCDSAFQCVGRRVWNGVHRYVRSMEQPVVHVMWRGGITVL